MGLMKSYDSITLDTLKTDKKPEAKPAAKPEVAPAAKPVTPPAKPPSVPKTPASAVKPAAASSSSVSKSAAPASPSSTSASKPAAAAEPKSSVKPDIKSNASPDANKQQPKAGTVKREHIQPDTGVPKRKAAALPGDTVQVPKFPKEVMKFVRQEFPDAKCNQDALAAYVYIKSGRAMTVSDDIKDLAKTYSGDKTIENMESRMKTLEDNIRALSKLAEETELALSLLLYDRYGFRQDSPSRPDNIDMLESGYNGVLAVRERLRKSIALQKKQDNIRDGRPIR